MLKLIDEGDWGHSRYKAFLDLNGQARKENITGVAVVCFDEEGKVVLMNFEPLGGHIEAGETVKGALAREALEEGGVKLERWKYFGYYEIERLSKVANKRGRKYPKIGYILFFVGRGRKVREPYGNDVGECQRLKPDEVLAGGMVKHKMLKEGVKLYPDYFDYGSDRAAGIEEKAGD